jgi:hypothetical protein
MLRSHFNLKLGTFDDLLKLFYLFEIIKNAKEIINDFKYFFGESLPSCA